MEEVKRGLGEAHLLNLFQEALRIRYVKLHVTLQFIKKAFLPVHKVSALRGGMGEIKEDLCIGLLGRN